MGIALLLLSAFLHAAWNALLARERDPGTSVATVLATSTGFALAVAWAAHASLGGRAALPWALGAGLFEGLYFLTLAPALERAGLAVAYPIARGGAMVLGWPVSLLFLGERASFTQLTGAAILCAGIALVAAGKNRTVRPSRAGGVPLALACAATVAGYHVCYGRALEAGAHPAPLFAVALCVALPMVAGALWRQGRLRGILPASWRHTGVLVLSGAISTLSFLLFLTGLAHTGAGLALTLRNSSVLFAEAFAWALGERPSPGQLAGTLLVALGAGLVSGG